MSHDPSCIFCKIARGEIPAATVLETDRTLAFLDIGPLNPGHVLVIPREHYASLLDLHRARKLAKRLGAQTLADNITAEIQRRLDNI